HQRPFSPTQLLVFEVLCCEPTQPFKQQRQRPGWAEDKSFGELSRRIPCLLGFFLRRTCRLFTKCPIDFPTHAEKESSQCHNTVDIHQDVQSFAVPCSEPGIGYNHGKQ